MDDNMIGKQLGVHDGRSEFWQINIGHVLTMFCMLGGGLLTMASVVYSFAELRVEYSDLKTGLSELRSWKVAQDADNITWHQQINQSFDSINRHLERLDWTVQERPEQNVPAILRKGHQ